MYKIYINETPLYLIEDKLVTKFAQKKGDHLIARYSGKPKTLLNYVDMLEKGSSFDSVILYHQDINRLFEEFVAHFLILEAAGGLVLNPARQLLMIFRRGFWDLPKGKIDEGEVPPAAAIREVEEETGIKNIVLGDFLQKSYHTYKDKTGTRILKLTHWYLMEAPDQLLIPQQEEDIEQAVWVNVPDFIQKEEKIYGNIKDLLLNFML